jgi:hypothetical protein
LASRFGGAFENAVDRGDALRVTAHGDIERMFHGTPWKKSYPYVLRRLPGARPGKRMSGVKRHRTTFIPAALLAPDAGG